MPSSRAAVKPIKSAVHSATLLVPTPIYSPISRNGVPSSARMIAPLAAGPGFPREPPSANNVACLGISGHSGIFLFERLTVDDEFAALVRAGRTESHAALVGDDLDDLTARCDGVAGVHRFEETQRLRERDPAGFLQQHPVGGRQET